MTGMVLLPTTSAETDFRRIGLFFLEESEYFSRKGKKVYSILEDAMEPIGGYRNNRTSYWRSEYQAEWKKLITTVTIV